MKPIYPSILKINESVLIYNKNIMQKLYLNYCLLIVK